MRKRILLVGIVAMSIAAAFVFLQWSKKEAQKEEHVTGGGVLLSYTNPVFGYTIQYPDTFEMVEEATAAEFRDRIAPVLEGRDLGAGEIALVEKKKNRAADPVVYTLRVPSFFAETSDTFEAYAEQLGDGLRKQSRKYETLFREREVSIGDGNIPGKEFSFEAEIPQAAEGRFGVFFYTAFKHRGQYFLFHFRTLKEANSFSRVKTYHDILNSLRFPKITQIFRIEDTLNQTLEEATTSFGAPQTSGPEETIWMKESIAIYARKSNAERPFHEVSVVFPEDTNLTPEEALAAVGLAAFPSPSLKKRDPLQAILQWNFVNGFGMIVVRGDPVEELIVKNRDVVVKKDMLEVAKALELYSKRHGIYPSSSERLVFWNAENADQTLLSQAVWPEYARGELSEHPIPAPSGGISYGYRSDGKTYYEITVPLADHTDPECVMDGLLCIFRIRNGVAASRKNS